MFDEIEMLPEHEAAEIAEESPGHAALVDRCETLVNRDMPFHMRREHHDSTRATGLSPSCRPGRGHFQFREG
jgi:hypothetical protein